MPTAVGETTTAPMADVYKGQVQGITRLARDKTQQDARLDMEGRAKKLLDRVG